MSDSSDSFLEKACLFKQAVGDDVTHGSGEKGCIVPQTETFLRFGVQALHHHPSPES